MRRKLIILTSVFIFFVISVFAQDNETVKNENYDIRNFRFIQIKIASPQTHISLRNIHSILVIDNRPDSGAIGFMQKHPLNHAFIILNKRVRQETEDFINNYLQLNKSDSSGTLVMVLKKMWLTDELITAADNEYVNEKIWNDTKEFTSGIKMKAEFYYKKENDYYPLYRYDSVFRDSSTVTKRGPRYIHDAIIASLAKISFIDGKLSDLTNKRRLTWEEIIKHNSDDFDLPVLKDSIFQRGVYMTFDEFKNNRPSQNNFEVKKDKKNDILYIVQSDGKEFVERNFWGYCDGKKSFVKAGENFFVLQRHENAFYIYGAKKLTRRFVDQYGIPVAPTTSSSGPSISPSGSSVSRTLPSLRLEPLQLDWDSGKLD